MLTKNKDKLTFDVTKSNEGETYIIKRDGVISLSVSPDLVTQTKEEIRSYYYYLNTIFGALSFTLAIAIQGTPNPPLNAALALTWVLIGHFAIDNKFPPHLKNLGKSKTKEIKFLVKNIAKLHLTTTKTFIKAPLFYIGYLYLMLMTLMNFNEVRDFSIFGKTLSQIFFPPH